MTQSPLIQLVDAFCLATGRSEARVANLAGMGSAFFPRIRNGRRCWPETESKVIVWFQANWPVDVDWPRGVDRPLPRKAPPTPSPTQADAA